MSFECGRMRAYGGSAIKIEGCARDDGARGADRFTRVVCHFLEDGILVS